MPNMEATLSSLTLSDPVVPKSVAAVLLSDDLLPLVLQQCDFPTLLAMQGACRLWRSAVNRLHKKRLISLLSYYFERPFEFSIFMRSLKGAVSGSTILKLLFPVDDLIIKRPLTDLDLYFRKSQAGAVSAFLLKQGYKHVGEEADISNEEYDGIPLSVRKYEKNGIKVDVILCGQSPTSAITEYFYGTHVMNWWSGGRLHCSSPKLTFHKEVEIVRNWPRAKELIQTKWKPCGFKIYNEECSACLLAPEFYLSCSIGLDL